MRERSFEILKAAIRDFINFGEPISSASLFARHDFGIKPAMIRAELAWLTEEGYLEQSYHSAGRIPSNKGYELFAARMLEEKKPQPVRDNLAESLAGGELGDFLARLSEELGIATAAGTLRGEIYKEGLDELMEHVDWGPRESMMQIIRDFDSIEQRLSALKNELLVKEFLNVFIGKKSPVTRSDELAVFGGDYDIGGERIILFAIGPKRMNYEKTAAIFKGLKGWNKE